MTLPPSDFTPQRIICLTEEPTEILYLLGQEHRIVGISAYTERPPEAKQRHPVVSAFLGGSVKKIKALRPDLVIGFSDIQAQLAHDLIKENLQVLIFNQRSIHEILGVVMTLGRIVGAQQLAHDLVQEMTQGLAEAEARTKAQARRPRVYFEEWDDPLICGIQWVHELVELAGGQNVFGAKAQGKLAKERFVTHPQIIQADPEIILASWCGKPVDIPSITQRQGYQAITAVQQDQIHELDPAIILQPGPASLTEGLRVLEGLIRPLA